MFPEMKRTDRKITLEESHRILERGEFGIFNTSGENGYAYGVPVNYVFDEEAIYFHCARKKGHKIDNIHFNDKVSFTVIGDTKIIPEKFSTRYESVIVFGRAELVEGEKKKDILRKILLKYSPDFMEKGEKYIAEEWETTGIVKILVEHITGKALK